MIDSLLKQQESISYLHYLDLNSIIYAITYIEHSYLKQSIKIAVSSISTEFSIFLSKEVSKLFSSDSE